MTVMADFLPNPYRMMRSFHCQGINMGPILATLTAFDHHRAIQQSVSIRILVKFLFACGGPIYLSKRSGLCTHRGCPTGENPHRILVRMEKFQVGYDRKSSRQLQTNWVLPCLPIFSFYNAIRDFQKIWRRLYPSKRTWISTTWPSRVRKFELFFICMAFFTMCASFLVIRWWSSE